MVAYPYTPPIDAMMDSLTTIGRLDEILALPAYQQVDAGLANAILEEAGRFAADRLAPLNQPGDREKAVWQEGRVTMPSGFRDAYQAFVAGGWNMVPSELAHGGQQLPAILNVAISELWNSANMSFALCPMLTQGAVEMLAVHGTEALKAIYLPRLVSGEWTGTMCLTEPQAGSDVGVLRCSAVPDGDAYRITGTKIYITYGEHDLADNIIHMVLARLPDAPPGSKGISLFLVPTFLPDAQGQPGERNDVTCLSIEEKLGIHASPTCVMHFGDELGAIGYLIGEPHRGLSAMFTMMNNARLQVGVEGLGIASYASQLAEQYADERHQGASPGDRSGQQVPIADHPDVQQMLLTLQAHQHGVRGLIMLAARMMDMARYGGQTDSCDASFSVLNFLTPIVKAYATDVGVSTSSLALQVFGGLGYVEETGVAQLYRDARIAPIYEGTNGIQAHDLLTRKLTLQKGEVASSLWRICCDSSASGALTDAIQAAQQLGDVLRAALADKPHAALSSASDYLNICGIVLENWALDQLHQAHADKYAAYAAHHTGTILPMVQAKIAAIHYRLNAE